MQDDLHHQLLLLKRYISVLRVEGVLLQQTDTDDSRGLDDELLVIGKHIGADQLDDLHQGVFLLKQRAGTVAVFDKLLSEVLLEPRVEVVEVLAVAVNPVDRGIVSCIGERLIERPEYAGEALGVLGDRLGKVRALRRYRADQADAALAAAEHLGTSAALIELRKTGRQIRGEALLRRHFLESSRDLSERLRPTGGRIRHHRDVIAHVAVIFRQSDARVDGRLTRRDGHVGGVRNQGGAVGHGAVGLRVDQLGELVEHLAHLVAALAAADVDDDIRVAPLRELVLVHGFARAETAGDGGCAALRDREERVHDALSRDQRDGGRESLLYRPRRSDGPLLAELQLMTLTEIVLDHRDSVKYFVFAVGLDFPDDAREVGVQHESVLDDRRFGKRRVDLTALEPVAHRDLHGDCPVSFGVE